MSYTKGESIEKQRGNAVKEVILEKRSVSQVSRRYGRPRSTIYRQLDKWYTQNPHISFTNYNRPGRLAGIRSHTERAKWNIVIISSRPKYSPRVLSDATVSKTTKTKLEIKRSNYIIWLTLRNERIMVSFSSVRRVMAKHHSQRVKLYGKKCQKKNNPRRLEPKHPGDLVEVNTVYLTNNVGGKDLFITNIIDVCSRVTYSWQIKSLVIPLSQY